jgi:hypothetical protein
VVNKPIPKPKLILKSKGRPSEQYLKNATYWAIAHRKPKGSRQEPRGESIDRAYEIFKADATSKESFKNALYRLWRETSKAWTVEKNKLDEVKRKRFTIEKFAKKYLKIAHKVDK